MTGNDGEAREKRAGRESKVGGSARNDETGAFDKISHCIPLENGISAGQKLKLLRGTREIVEFAGRYRYAFRWERVKGIGSR